jgi:hypothetical protein
VNEFTGLRQVELVQLEKRVLDAARQEEPPAELSARMAGAIGVSLGAVLGASVDGAAAAAQTGTLGGLGAASSGAVGPGAVAPGAVAPGGSGALGNGLAASKGALGWSGVFPWVAGVVVVAAVAATSLQSSTTDQTVRTPVDTVRVEQAEPPAEESVVPVPVPLADESREDERAESDARENDETPYRKVVKSPAPNDLGAEIALVDSARAAVRSGSNRRALGLIAEYLREFPKGSFRPEATALKIEALVNLDRRTEARALARSFVATRRGTPLGDRVARIAGLDSSLE